MALNLTPIADGELPLAKATLYTVPSGKSAMVRIEIVNKSGANKQVNIYYKKSGGSSRLMTPLNLDLPTRYKSIIQEEPFTMGAGDQIEGDATAAASVDYIIFGQLEDLVITV